MMNEKELNSTIDYAFLFGQIAIRHGFITEQQLETALDEQIDHDLNNDDHKLIGEILLEKGWMTQEQIAIVLQEIVRNKQKRSKAF